MSSRPTLEAVVAIAREAGALVASRFQRPHQVEQKVGAGIVTEVDRQAESLIVSRIRERWPASTIVAEESGRSERAGALCWLIDPLDGTSNFARGLPWFAVSIALELDGELELGVVHHPLDGRTFSARRGGGAYLDDAPMRVSTHDRVDGGFFATGFYYHRGEVLTGEVARFERVQQRALGVRRAGAAALDLAYVANGTFDGFWEHGLSPWDVAAGILLVTEAGGAATDYAGQALSPYSQSFVLSNGRVHSELLAAIGA